MPGWLHATADVDSVARPETAEGKRLLKQGCQKGPEGLIAKRADSAYVSQRSRLG